MGIFCLLHGGVVFFILTHIHLNKLINTKSLHIYVLKSLILVC